MMAKNHAINRVIFFRPNCKMWKCDFCGQQRARWFMLLAAHGHDELTAEGRHVYFATVTSRQDVRTMEKGLKRWRSNWPKLLRRMKRAGGFCAYLQVPEQHKSGAFHVHLLTTCTITERWLKDNAASCGFGYIADYEQVRASGKAAQYVSKYLTKDSHRLKWPKYFRRVNLSRNWPRPIPLEKSNSWEVELAIKGPSIHAQIAVQRLKGWSVDVFTA